jgi:4-hydroxy-3-methylbut-2-enyl diphosphate reductase
VSDLAAAALPPLTVRLANPRGFCAGVDRAIDMVGRALTKYGAPVYVRHEIVHNRFVVNALKRKGAIFVETLDDIEDQSRPVIFSAHGVPKAVPADAAMRAIHFIDATCPLVSKVHREAERHHAAGRHVILIGHAGHPEVDGTMGQLPDGTMTLIETVADVARLDPADSENLAYVTQTTLSVDDTATVIAALQQAFPSIVGPKREDICYATTNRQKAMKDIAGECDLVLVLGAQNSSNSNRLVDVARTAGARQAQLIDRACNIDWTWFKGVKTMGLSAGASAPETLVEEVLTALRSRYEVAVENPISATENIVFRVPRELEDPRPSAVS